MFWQSQQTHIIHLLSQCHQDMSIPILLPLHHISFPPLQYSLHIFCMLNFLKALEPLFLNPTHPLWIHIPHCTHNTELAYTRKQQTADEPTFRQTIFCDVAADHYLGFPMANSQTHALNSPLPFQELISESLDCLTMSSAYMNSLSTSFVISINIRKCGEKPNLRSPTHV